MHRPYISAEQREKDGAARVSVVAAVLLTATKLIVGAATGSLGLISEAAHSGLDLVAALVTAVAVRVSGKPADSSHQFGHGKVENFSALFEAVLLLATCGWIVFEAVQRLATGRHFAEVNAWSFAVLLFSIAVDANRTAVLRRVAAKWRSQALEADALHFASDIASSGVVIVGLVLVKLGYPVGDPLAALGVAGLVAVASVRLIGRTVSVLIDAAPRGASLEATKAAAAVPGVLRCTHARVRQSGAHTFADIRVEVADDAHMVDVDVTLHQVEEAVKRVLPDADVTVRPEVAGCANAC